MRKKRGRRRKRLNVSFVDLLDEVLVDLLDEMLVDVLDEMLVDVLDEMFVDCISRNRLSSSATKLCICDVK